MECHSTWSVTYNGMSHKMECHSKQNVTKNEMSHKLECYSNSIVIPRLRSFVCSGSMRTGEVGQAQQPSTL